MIFFKKDDIIKEKEVIKVAVSTKDKLILEIAEDLMQRFDADLSKEVVSIIGKHLYNY